MHIVKKNQNQNQDIKNKDILPFPIRILSLLMGAFY